ncbi:MAG TPA: ribosome maturation factor RimP [Syntrophomonadaceae bacterium]|nr:ribosome maturation factor RimP [Syntrophomonadaceae bacterium]
MSRKSLAIEIERQIQVELEKVGIEVLEVEYRKEHGDLMLRVYIDTESGVTLDTCSRATGIIKEIIGQNEQISYDHLEVSSPGIDRKLVKDRDFERFKGERVKVKLLQALDGQKVWVGQLAERNQDNLVLLGDKGTVIHLPRELISFVRLHPDL